MNSKQQIDLPEFLGRIEPYSALDPEAFARLVTAARPLCLERGQTLFEQGQTCDGIYVVVSGQIKLAFYSPHGAEKVVAIVTAQQGIGEACMSLGQDYPFHAEALVDTTLVFLPQQALLACLNSNRNFTYSLMRQIAEKLHNLLLDVESSAMLSGTERVVDFLMRQIRIVADDGSAIIALSLPKSIIASRLSLTQEHFSRLLRNLSESGLIIVEGRLIRIPEVARLSRFLDSGAAHGTNRSGRSSGRGRASWERLAVA